VFIDFDNVEIGVRNTLNSSFDAGLVLDALKERGEVVSKMAYGDWQRSGGYSRMLTQHAIRMVQRNPTPGGDKNGADINLALDALEMAFTHTHINAFVIVGGDSDFISLVEKLKQYDKQIFIVGGRQFTSQILQRNCHEFIAYENLTGAGATPAAAGRGRQPGRGDRADRAPIEQAVPLVLRALKVLSEREVSPQLGLLKTTLLQLDSTFSERTFGAGSFRDFAEKLQSAESPDDGQPAERPAHLQGASPQGRPTAVIGTPADGVREFARALGSMQIRRWPLYLRNVKQLLRQAHPSFDERAYGFANLVDLLRAAHKEGAVRVERDRQGVIRVFQGTAPSRLPSDTPAPILMDESPDAPDLDVAVAVVPADLDLPTTDAIPDESPQAAEEPAPAARSGRSRRRRGTEARRTSRKKAQG
jgi:NYN domain-containing protein/OST-HTH/LOTUS domain-containing protein